MASLDRDVDRGGAGQLRAAVVDSVYLHADTWPSIYSRVVHGSISCDPTQPTTSGKIRTQPNPIQLTMELTVW